MTAFHRPSQSIIGRESVSMWALLGSAVVLVVCSLALPLIFAVSRRRRILKPLPGLKESFLLGHAGHFLNATPPEIFKTLLEGFKQCGKTWKVFLLDDTLVVSSEPKVMEVSVLLEFG